MQVQGRTGVMPDWVLDPDDTFLVRSRTGSHVWFDECGASVDVDVGIVTSSKGCSQ